MVPKLIGIVAALLVLAAVAAAIALSFVARPGASDRLTQYVGRQIAGIANTYLVPDLAFERVTLEQGRTVRLTGVTLTAPDGAPVVDLAEMIVTLDEIPSRGEPLRIARVELRDGTVTITRDAQTGAVRGLVPFVERGVSDEAQASVEENFRLSSVLVLERVEIADVDISIDLGDGAGPMRVDGFGLSLDVAEAADEEGAPSGPGWYDLAFTSGRAPGLQLDVDGRLNLDTFEAFIRSATGSIELAEGTYTSLPGRLAEPLRARDARGLLELSLSGSLPLRDPTGGSDLDVTATLTNANIASGDFRLPIDAARATVELAGGIATVPAIHADMLKGTVDARGSVNLNAPGTPTSLSWTLAGLDLEDLLRAQGEDAPDLAGILAGTGEASISLAGPLGSLSGAGEMTLSDGRLVAVPVLTQLAEVASVAGFGSGAEKNHRANATFTLTGEGVHLDESDLVTNTLAARVTGLIGYTGSLDLAVNAGPLEKVQDLLGGIGELLGKVTDQLVTYKVGGTTSEPEISVAPLGIGG